MKKLTEKELRELKGGALPPGGNNPANPGDRDVINSNQIKHCICTFNDYKAVSNDNEIEGCKCYCEKI